MCYKCGTDDESYDPTQDKCHSCFEYTEDYLKALYQCRSKSACKRHEKRYWFLNAHISMWGFRGHIPEIE